MVMALVEQETCNSQAQIAERLGLDKTVLTYLLDDLEKGKLIKRSTDPADRRNRHIGLTAKGSKTLLHFAGIIVRLERELLGRLTDDEASQFQSLLFKAAGLADPPSASAEDPTLPGDAGRQREVLKWRWRSSDARPALSWGAFG